MTTSELVASSIEALIEKYKHEITRDGDWWWGNDSVDINIHCPNDDGVYPAKSPVGMFPLYIPNDLGQVVTLAQEYYG